MGIKFGDEDCFRKLFLKYYPRFRTYILRLVQDAWVTEDILQDIFMKVWYNRNELEPDLSIVAYLFVLAKYEILNYRRSLMRHPSQSITLEVKELCDTVPGVDDDYNFTELQRRLRQAVNDLPPKRRMVFIKNRYEFKTAAEIAAETGLSKRTVEKHIELALRSIRAAIGSSFI